MERNGMRTAGFSRLRSLGPLKLWAVASLVAGGASAQPVDSSMSFFITGAAIGQGGNFGGLSGADAHCQQLAASVGAGARIWRAYLSTQAQGEAPGINARDRIGAGPWFNANGVQIAASVSELHGVNNLDKQTALTQTGAIVNGRGDSPNQHDIITGSRADGTAPAAGADSTCANWTSSAAAPARTLLGHHDRMGISSNIDPQSWNQAHISSGCTQANVQQGGGAGYFYCFAADSPATGLIPHPLPRRIAGAIAHAPYVLPPGARSKQIVFRFVLDNRARVEVTAHAPSGRRIAVLTRGILESGNHPVFWDGTDSKGTPLSAGLYLIALRTLEGKPETGIR